MYFSLMEINCGDFLYEYVNRSDIPRAKKLLTLLFLLNIYKEIKLHNEQNDNETQV